MGVAICKATGNTIGSDVIYKIHPAIGIARVGNSSEFFIGPEKPGKGATGNSSGVGKNVPPFKTAPGVIRWQAARFWIYKYVWNETLCQYRPHSKIYATTPGVKKLTWWVQLANRKASFYKFKGTNGERPPYGPSVTFMNTFPGDAIATGITPGAPGVKRNGGITLDITPDPVKISGTNKGPEEIKWVPPATIPITYLGELHTDNQGRLLVLGGKGEALSPGVTPLVHYANNNDWFDDVSDGWVNAEIEFDSGRKVTVDEIEGAWVLVGPPDYAPPIGQIVNLYETLTDVAIQHLTFPGTNGLYDTYLAGRGLKHLVEMKAAFAKPTGLSDAYKISFARDVYPILQRAMDQSWVHRPGGGAYHSTFSWPALSNFTAAGKAGRTFSMGITRIPAGMTRPPDPAFVSDPYMPKLLGDEAEQDAWPSATAASGSRANEYLTLTAVQYAILIHWYKGNAGAVTRVIPGGWPASNNPADLPAPSNDISPEGLDRAALENCVGGAFYPGIEASWLIRNPKIYREPFRLEPWERDIAGKIKRVGVAPGLGGIAGDRVPREIEYGKPGDPGSTKLKFQAGFFSQQMALPWQADFHACKLEPGHSLTPGGGAIDIGWWPAQRPDNVRPAVGAAFTDWDDGVPDLITEWKKRRFVRKVGAEYLGEEPG